MNLKKLLKKIKKPIVISGGIFEQNSIKDILDKYQVDILKKDFWEDKTKAQNILKKKNFYENLINNYNNFVKEITSLEELFILAEKENVNDILEECYQKAQLLFSDIKKIEVKCFLSGESDHLDSYLEVHAGAGGTESQDWADMLRKMYLKWSDKKKFKYQIISEHKGEEAGIKSSTLKISGEYVYGFLKNESGVHRLVRISPFDSGARRHTSFASVWVYPVADESIKIDIQEKDLRIDTYRSSGAGGQHVNTTDSAVRITHMPTGIVVQCQNERSQHKNKETCFNMLKARLYEFEIKKKEKKNESLEKSKSEIGWGHQIRSYVLQPYQLVKDLRSNLENTDPKKVLNGEIDSFLEAELYRSKLK